MTRDRDTASRDAVRRMHEVELFTQNDGRHPCGHERIDLDPWLDCRTCAQLEAEEAQGDDPTKTVDDILGAWRRLPRPSRRRGRR